MFRSVLSRNPHASLLPRRGLGLWQTVRLARYQAYDAGFDAEELSAARSWFQTFQQSSLPKGTTIYSRSSGAGGQHVNKTESKATTSWSVDELTAITPKMLHSKIRASSYYSKRNDSISFQAQTERSRGLNAEGNRQKLFDELVRLYQETVPGESSPDKKQKYEAIEKSFHERRILEKKRQSSKKLLRTGGGD